MIYYQKQRELLMKTIVVFFKLILTYIIKPLIIAFGFYLVLYFTYHDLNEQPQVQHYKAKISIRVEGKEQIDDLPVIEVIDTKNKMIFYKLDPITSQRLGIEKIYSDDDFQKIIYLLVIPDIK